MFGVNCSLFGASLSEPHLVCPAEVLSKFPAIRYIFGTSRTSRHTRMVEVNVIADSPRVVQYRLALHAYGLTSCDKLRPKCTDGTEAVRRSGRAGCAIQGSYIIIEPNAPPRQQKKWSNDRGTESWLGMLPDLQSG